MKLMRQLGIVFFIGMLFFFFHSFKNGISRYSFRLSSAERFLQSQSCVSSEIESDILLNLHSSKIDCKLHSIPIFLTNVECSPKIRITSLGFSCSGNTLGGKFTLDSVSHLFTLFSETDFILNGDSFDIAKVKVESFPMSLRGTCKIESTISLKNKTMNNGSMLINCDSLGSSISDLITGLRSGGKLSSVLDFSVNEIKSRKIELSTELGQWQGSLHVSPHRLLTILGELKLNASGQAQMNPYLALFAKDQVKQSGTQNGIWRTELSGNMNSSLQSFPDKFVLKPKN